MKIKVTKLHCLRCKWDWFPTQEDINQCPHCRSKYWNVEVPPKKGWPKGKKRKLI
jgi:DNA-directed RNA polymerase subunit RPC12/RpoP